jgi:nucleoid-associated protein YgaU
MRELPPGEYMVRADQVEGGSGSVVARAEVPFEREIEVAILKPTAASGGQGSAEVSGSVADPTTVIIKRGDNLWRISRDMYGEGLRYSTIYQANREQIRNPDLIYPGQVFVLPSGDTTWESN